MTAKQLRNDGAGGDAVHCTLKRLICQVFYDASVSSALSTHLTASGENSPRGRLLYDAAGVRELRECFG